MASPQPGEVEVRTLFSGISRGTESLVFRGNVPESEYARMRGPNMGGSFPFPVKYGYAAVGIVEEGPDDLAGKAVFCLHPHQERFVVAAGQVRLLPENLPPERAILAANMETALNVIWDAGILPGDKVAVYGAGVVGTLTAYLSSRIAGTETVLVDINPQRADLAAPLGLNFSAPGELPGEFDVLINASGSDDALRDALDRAGQEARIVEASWHGERRVQLPLGGAFHARRLSLISSQVSSIPRARCARWDYGRRIRKALELLCDPCLDALISGETCFRDLPGSYARILSDEGTLCHRVRYSH